MTLRLEERISDYVTHWALHRPTAIAFSCGSAQWTYADLAAEVDRWAGWLLGRHVRRGDRVALLSRPTPEAVAVYLAVASVGATFQGLNPAYTQAELDYVIGDARPVLVLDALDGRALLAGSAAGTTVVPWADADAEACDLVSATRLNEARTLVRPEDPALLVHTSGSTGRPKGALLPHRSLAFAAHVHAERWLQHHDASTLCPFPINHVASLSDICGSALAAGARTVFLPEFDAGEVLRTIERERVTMWGFIPAVAVLATQQPEWTTVDLTSVRHAVWGGGAASAALLTALRAKGLPVEGCYGSTETVGNVCFTQPGADDATLLDTIGRPHPSYEVRVARTDGSTCAAGEEGELLVRATHAFAGYLDRPDDTAAALDHDGWLHTGDVAVRRDDGCLRLVGRVHEAYKSGGYNVYPREVELALEALPGVSAAAVVPVPDDVFGEVGVAFVVTEDNDVSALRAMLRAGLAAYKIPKRLVRVDELPLLPVGKVDKRRLRERALEPAR